MLYILESKQNNNNQILNNPQVTIQCGRLKQSELQGFFYKEVKFYITSFTLEIRKQTVSAHFLKNKINLFRNLFQITNEIKNKHFILLIF